MKVYYDWVNRTWGSFTNSTFGSNHIPFNKITFIDKGWLPFTIQSNEENRGPIIGILTGKGIKEPFSGNNTLFKQLQKEILKNGGISVVFTADGIKEKELDGYTFLPSKNKWLPITCPLPHLVYNRTPSRSLEKSKKFQNTTRFFQDKCIPFFNPCFIDKYLLYEWLKESDLFRAYLPDTILVDRIESLKQFLEKHKKIYLKPTQGALGKGIYQLELMNDKKLKMTDTEQTLICDNFYSFWREWQPKHAEISYLAQESIIPAQLYGKRFDFRILAHYAKNSYQVTGIGIRQSNRQEITTHVPSGGVAIPYHLVQTAEHDEFIATIVQEAGKILSEKLSFFGEFSIDAGISNQGEYVIYELNSKPMSFDEEEIETNRMKALVQLFFEQSAFPIHVDQEN